MCQQSTFIRSLTTAAAQSCIGELLMIIFIVSFVMCRSCLMFQLGGKTTPRHLNIFSVLFVVCKSYVICFRYDNSSLLLTVV